MYKGHEILRIELQHLAERGDRLLLPVHLGLADRQAVEQIDTVRVELQPFLVLLDGRGQIPLVVIDVPADIEGDIIKDRLTGGTEKSGVHQGFPGIHQDLLFWGNPRTGETGDAGKEIGHRQAAGCLLGRQLLAQLRQPAVCLFAVQTIQEDKEAVVFKGNLRMRPQQGGESAAGKAFWFYIEMLQQNDAEQVGALRPFVKFLDNLGGAAVSEEKGANPQALPS